MPTIDEIIAKLQDEDAESAKVLEDLVKERDSFKSHSRNWENQAKTNRADAEAKRSAEARVAELEKELEDMPSLKKQIQELEGKVHTLEPRVQEYEKKETRQQLVSKVASSKSIPSNLVGYLRGDTEEELEASAEQLKRDFKFGEVDGFGNDGSHGSSGTLESGKELYENYVKN